MGLVASKTKEVMKEPLELSKQEFEFLLTLIKDSTFKGQDIEVIYKVTSKLQKHYLERYQKK